MPAPNVTVSLIIGAVLVGIGTPISIAVGLPFLLLGFVVQIALSYSKAGGRLTGSVDLEQAEPTRSVAPYKVPQGEDISEY